MFQQVLLCGLGTRPVPAATASLPTRSEPSIPPLCLREPSRPRCAVWPIVLKQILLCGLRTRPAPPTTASLPIRSWPKSLLSVLGSLLAQARCSPGPVRLARQLTRFYDFCPDSKTLSKEIGSRAAVCNYKHRCIFMSIAK